MSTSKMLIDASHPEETRVVVLKGHRVEEFDFESANKRQLRGNIYLAKVTRVEPSLQAAFIDYGGNRHGFLAFSEIHPDYYQIPHADRQALLEDEARAHREEDEETRGNGHRRSRRHRRDGTERAADRRGPAEDRVSEAVVEEAPPEDAVATWNRGPVEFDGGSDETLEADRDIDGEAVPREPPATAPFASGEAIPLPSSPDVGLSEGLPPSPASAMAEPAEPDVPEATAEPTDAVATAAGTGEAAEASDPVVAAQLEGGSDSPLDPPEARAPDEGQGEDDGEEEGVEQIGGDAFEESAQRPSRPRRHYKIQEVIKRRQILLVQVVKEERGNKGAALTTYLSLAGRYSVLMPNTARGGGISRKITDADDRKRLKAIAQDLDVPEGMGIILRTAGAARSQVEVNRDFEYLLRMWESVRELTLKSTAPTLVYEEGSLVKRAIRDLYTRDVEDVIVSGEDGFREARDFMRMLIPSATKNVQLYRDAQPIFAKAGVEAQLDAMFSNHVTLRSGGYLVINQTEALVAIDVNSGRSTREHNIEDTAIRTNLEAADEVARQLRLRDLAGLIVVDFIDMEEGRNNRAVERRIKEALKNDRARIQIGRISHFGLLEMSRQRIRTGVLEGSTVICPHCAGSGTIRSIASIALHVLRLVEDALLKDASHDLIVRTRTEVALYILNQKRAKLNDLETRFGVALTVAVDAALTGMIYHAIERGEPATPAVAQSRQNLVRVDSVAPIFDDVGSDLVDEETDDTEEAEEDGAPGERDGAQAEGGLDGGRRKRRRRRRRGRDRDTNGDVPADGPQPPDDALATMARIGGDFPVQPPADDQAEPADGFGSPDTTDLAAEDAGLAAGDTEASAPPMEPIEAPEPTRRRRSRRAAKTADDTVALVSTVAGTTSADEPGTAEDSGPAPKRRRRGRAASPVAESPAEPLATVVPPSADRDVGADTVEHHPPEAEPETVDEPAPQPGSATPPPSSQRQADLPGLDAAASAPPTPTQEAAPPVREEDPSRPKRSGWWQRAKATFGS
ncbi:MAG TPA: Rne/Rng family ribonuclease [Lichenihabitans sp.]|jgi:ribonuclease E|nr:Rne/Rng family ribonuclease [Lichenihabitans sp.]